MRLKTLCYIPLVFLFLSISSCSFYEDVEFLGVQDYSFESYEDSQIKASIVFKINNPNFYSIKVKKSDFDVFLDDIKLGNAEMLNNLKIKKNTEANYTLELLLDKEEVKKSFKPILKKAYSQSAITFRVKGKVKCSTMGVIRKIIEVDEKKKISIIYLIKDFRF